MAAPPPVILLVHGLGVKRSPEHELAKWQNALDRGLAGDAAYAAASIRMAYYSDALHPEVHTASRAARRRGSPPTAAHESEALQAVEDQMLDALEHRYWNYAATKTRACAASDAAGAPIGPVRRGPGARREVTPLPAVALQPGEAYHTFIRDVIKYFGLGHREPVNATLTAHLDAIPAGAPVLLISHSLGTIVAYDVLVGGSYQIDTWITLGSPLGYAQDLQAQLPRWLNDLDPQQLVHLAGVGATVEEAAAWIADTASHAKDKIEGFFASLRRRGGAPVRRGVYTLPPAAYPDDAVQRWYNLYDPTDPVAAPPLIGDPTLADAYLSHGHERVYDIALRNPGIDAHSEVGYLETLQTVWLVKDFLLRQQART